MLIEQGGPFLADASEKGILVNSGLTLLENFTSGFFSGRAIDLGAEYDPTKHYFTLDSKGHIWDTTTEYTMAVALARQDFSNYRALIDGYTNATGTQDFNVGWHLWKVGDGYSVQQGYTSVATGGSGFITKTVMLGTSVNVNKADAFLTYFGELRNASSGYFKPYRVWLSAADTISIYGYAGGSFSVNIPWVVIY